MKATILLTALFLAFSTPVLAEDLPKQTEREFYLSLCQEDLGKIQEFLHNNKALIQARWYDTIRGGIYEVYSTKEGDYTIEIMIVSSGKVCVIDEGVLYQDLRGFPI